MFGLRHVSCLTPNSGQMLPSRTGWQMAAMTRPRMLTLLCAQCWRNHVQRLITGEVLYVEPPMLREPGQELQREQKAAMERICRAYHPLRDAAQNSALKIRGEAGTTHVGCERLRKSALAVRAHCQPRPACSLLLRVCCPTSTADLGPHQGTSVWTRLMERTTFFRRTTRRRSLFHSLTSGSPTGVTFFRSNNGIVCACCGPCEPLGCLSWRETQVSYLHSSSKFIPAHEIVLRQQMRFHSHSPLGASLSSCAQQETDGS